MDIKKYGLEKLRTTLGRVHVVWTSLLPRLSMLLAECVEIQAFEIDQFFLTQILLVSHCQL